jgi:hypothetical protein
LGGYRLVAMSEMASSNTQSRNSYAELQNNNAILYIACDASCPFFAKVGVWSGLSRTQSSLTRTLPAIFKKS